jgi:hypothetical protein
MQKKPGKLIAGPKYKRLFARFKGQHPNFCHLIVEELKILTNDEQHAFIAEQDKEFDELGDKCKMKKLYQRTLQRIL